MITMYDTTTVSTVPPGPQAVAGYVGGFWPTYNSLVEKFPHAHHLSIAVTAGERARCLDVEPGDATNVSAVGWFHNFADRSQGKPVFYTSSANSQALINTLDAAGIHRDSYWLWSAHYTFNPHICGRNTCGYPNADATQWTDKALGRNLDESLVNDYVFVDAPKPAPEPAHARGVANFSGSFDVQNGRWTIRGIEGSFKPGTKGGKAAAYITFDETNGRWNISPEPWARKPKVELTGTEPKGKPIGTANFTGTFDLDNGQWIIRGVPGSFQPGAKGGKAAAYLTFDEVNGGWSITGKPWARNPLKAIVDFFKGQ